MLLPDVVSKPHEGGIPAIYEHLKSTPPKTAWIVATGALTNVALLFAIHPDLAEHIAGVSVMGGAVGFGYTDAPLGTVEDRQKHTKKQQPFLDEYFQSCKPGTTAPFGNWSPWAEFNIFVSTRSESAVQASQ